MWTAIALTAAAVIAGIDIYFTRKDTKEYKKLQQTQQVQDHIEDTMDEKKIQQMSKQRLEEIQRKYQEIEDLRPYEVKGVLDSKNETYILEGLILYMKIVYHHPQTKDYIEKTSLIKMDRKLERAILELINKHIDELREEYKELANGG